MDGGEVLELCLKAIGVDHLALAGLALPLSGNPRQHIFPGSSHSTLLRVYHGVGTTMGGSREDELLVKILGKRLDPSDRLELERLPVYSS